MWSANHEPIDEKPNTVYAYLAIEELHRLSSLISKASLGKVCAAPSEAD